MLDHLFAEQLQKGWQLDKSYWKLPESHNLSTSYSFFCSWFACISCILCSGENSNPLTPIFGSTCSCSCNGAGWEGLMTKHTNYKLIHLVGVKKKKKKNHARPGVRTLKHLVRNNSRTEWSPIRSLIIRVRNKIIRPQKGESDLLITTMITDRIGRHDVRLLINQNYEKIWEEEKISNHPFLQKKKIENYN